MKVAFQHFTSRDAGMGWVGCINNSCVLLLADRRDILLLVTERRLDIQLSSWSVLTPPLAAWSVDQNNGAEAD